MSGALATAAVLGRFGQFGVTSAYYWTFPRPESQTLSAYLAYRNFDGKVDLVQQFSRGVLAREIHDDDFDGKPETIDTFRNGKLAIIERDPNERGIIEIAEYYDDSGKLIRREVRHK